MKNKTFNTPPGLLLLSAGVSRGPQVDLALERPPPSRDGSTVRPVAVRSTQQSVYKYTMETRVSSSPTACCVPPFSFWQVMRSFFGYLVLVLAAVTTLEPTAAVFPQPVDVEASVRTERL